MANPRDFHVGVLDLFAVLLPGAVATALLGPRVGDLIVGSLVSRPTSDPAAWFAFLVAAYFLGHLVFLLGSYLDPLYNRLRRRLDPYDDKSAYQAATEIRNGFLIDGEREALNTFQWSRSVLLAKFPSGAQDVHRLEADSKFFRSLLIVCALAATVFLFEGGVVEAVIAGILILPCFARYYERRLKSTTQAYAHVVTLHRTGDLVRSRSSDA